MDVNIYESSARTRGVRGAVSAWTDEVEGELEKISVFGIYLTRKVILTILGILGGLAIIIGVSVGASSSSVEIKPGTIQEPNHKEHRYWVLGELIESSVGRAIFDEDTHEHEALVWLADSDPMRLDPTTPLEEILQRFALANLYFATNGDEWKDQLNFVSKKNVCKWNDRSSGVFCNDNNQVANLVLPDLNLNGTIPHDIGLLSNIQILNLTNNALHGTVPLSLGIMSSLRSIDLSKNGFTGPLPKSLASLVDLVSLDFSYNFIGGSDDIGMFKDLPSLEELHLNNNRLEGKLGQFGSSESLKIIDVSFNALGGTLPTKVTEGKKLKVLKVDNNMITGTIPAAIGKLYNLEQLDMSNNFLSGSIPTTFGDLISLQFLNLATNKLQKGLPADLEYLENLLVLDVSDNGIESIPSELFYLHNLGRLSLSTNRIAGSLPTEIGRATSLQALDISNNRMADQLPTEIGKLKHLAYLYLNDNLFDGNIPSELSHMSSLSYMDISNNKFFGSMESQFCERTSSMSPIIRYKADCLGDDIEFSCATECCDGNGYCCTSGQVDCEMPDQGTTVPEDEN